VEGVPARQYARPVVVAAGLEFLTGPTTGVVLLPRHLDWSGHARYDLDSPGRIIDLYRTVLIEASTPEDLHAYMHAATLMRVWSYLWLPQAVREAWDERFPQLAALSRLSAAG
jgi:hypothetical protein